MTADTSNSPGAPSPQSPSEDFQLDAQNPWPSLRSFSESHEAYFKGRQNEIEELFRRVRRLTLTVLYGVSGLGKTSLLKAGLAPRLRKAGFLPVWIRLDLSRDRKEGLLTQVKTAIALARHDSRHPYRATRDPLPNETLWEYFHRCELDIVDEATGKPVNVVLVFDQFEEFFTKARRDEEGRIQRLEFTAELAALTENRPPAALESTFDRDPSLRGAFDFSQQDYRIVLSLREDYLAHLDSLAGRIRSIRENGFRLLRLTQAPALQVVADAGAAVVDPDTAQEIVEFVAGEDERLCEREKTPESESDPRALAPTDYVSPALLSLVCFELNETRKKNGAPKITESQLQTQKLGILEGFYDRCFAGLPLAEQGPVRRLVEETMVTPDNQRDSVSMPAAITRLVSDGLTRERAAKALEHLRDQYLVQYEEREGRVRIELTHDILTRVAGPRRLERRSRERIAHEQEVLRKAQDQRQKEKHFRTKILMISGAAIAVAVGLFVVLILFFDARKSRNKATAANKVAEMSLKEQNRAVAGFVLARIQTEMNRTPPDAYAAALLWQQLAKNESQFTNVPHREVISLLIRPPPYYFAGAVRLPGTPQEMVHSPDGTLLAVRTADRRLRFIDYARREVFELPQEAGNGSVVAFDFAPFFSSELLIRTQEAALLRWDWKARRTIGDVHLADLPGFSSNMVLPIAFSPNGRSLAVARGDASIEIVNTDWPAQGDTTVVSNVSNRAYLDQRQSVAQPAIPDEWNLTRQRAFQGPYSTSTRYGVGKSMLTREENGGTPAPSSAPNLPPLSLQFLGGNGLVLGSANIEGYWFWRPETMGPIQPMGAALRKPSRGVPRFAPLADQVWALVPWGPLHRTPSPQDSPFFEEDSYDDTAQQSWDRSTSATRPVEAQPQTIRIFPDEFGLGRDPVIRVANNDRSRVPDGVNAFARGLSPELEQGFLAMTLRAGVVRLQKESSIVQELPHRGNVILADFRIDGLLVTASEDGLIKWWTAQESNSDLTPPDFFQFDRTAIGQSGRRMLAWKPPSAWETNSEGHSLSLYDLENHRELEKWTNGPPTVVVLGFAEGDPRPVRVATFEKTNLWVWSMGRTDPPRKTLLKLDVSLPDLEEPVGFGEAGAVDMEFSGRGNRIGVLVPNTGLFVCDVDTGLVVRRLEWPSIAPVSRTQPLEEEEIEGYYDRSKSRVVFCLSVEGNKLALARRNSGEVEVYDLERGEITHRVQSALNAVSALAFTPKGDGLLLGSRAGELALFDLPVALRDGHSVFQVRLPLMDFGGTSVEQIQLSESANLILVRSDFDGMLLRAWPMPPLEALARDGSWQIQEFNLTRIPEVQESNLDNLRVPDPISTQYNLSRLLTGELFSSLVEGDFLRDVAPDSLEAAAAPLRRFLDAHPDFRDEELPGVQHFLEMMPPWKTPTNAEEIDRRIQSITEIPFSSEASVTRAILSGWILPFVSSNSPARPRLLFQLAAADAQRLESIVKSGAVPTTHQSNRIEQLRERARSNLQEAKRQGFTFTEMDKRALLGLDELEFTPPEELGSRGLELLNLRSPDADRRADSFFRKALRENPSDPRAALGLGRLLVRQTESSHEKDLLQKAQAAAASDPRRRTHLLVGIALELWESGSRSEAVEVLRGGNAWGGVSDGKEPLTLSASEQRIYSQIRTETYRYYMAPK